MRVSLTDIVSNSRYRAKIHYKNRIFVDTLTGEKMNINMVFEKLRAIDPQLTTSELQAYLNTVDIEVEPAKPQINVDEAINRAMESLGAIFKTDEDGTMTFFYGSMPIKDEDLAIEICSQRNDEGLADIPKEKIIDRLHSKRTKERKRLFERLTLDIAFDAALGDKSNEMAEEIMRLVCGPDYKPIYATILRQVVWLVKKKFRGDDPRTILYPIFVNLYGQGHTGKSSLWEFLFSVIPKSLCKNENNSDHAFNDPRTYHSFMEKLVIIFGELSNMDKVSIEKFKNLIDMLRISMRALNFNRDADGPNFATLVGTSNRHLRDIIKDGPDVRKWIEIPFYYHGNKASQHNKSFLPLKAYDYRSFWKSVDVDGPCPLESVYTEFCELASKVCGSGLTTTEFFLKEYVDHNQSILLDGPQTKTLDEIYSSYKQAVSSMRIGQQKLAEAMVKTGFVKREFNYGNKWQIPRRHECCLFTDEELAEYKTSVDAKMTPLETKLNAILI
jgi:hypothetical protein